MNSFYQERFSGFWYTSGTPSFLLDLVKERPESYSGIGSFEMTEHMLESVDIDRVTVGPLLFQTGYLTIKEITFVSDEPVYILDIPNNEVRRALENLKNIRR